MQPSHGPPSLDELLTLPTLEELSSLSKSSFGYALPPHQLPVYHAIVCRWLQPCLHMHASGDLRKIDLSVPAPTAPVMLSDTCQISEQKPSQSVCASSQPREYVLVPQSGPSNPYGAWKAQCQLTQDVIASSLVLKGKRVVMKDNIPVRGLPMSCGTSFSFTPHEDSPLVTRCLAAGATVVGTAQCEYMCMSACSHTASAGLVRNPLAMEYHSGGSSSGCAVLVALGEADLGIGSDQGGSCRIPSAMTGTVGLKPTHGLLPYNLMDGMFEPIDHAGPITRTVEENALMLCVLAGCDGADERENVTATQRKWTDYCSLLKKGVEGMRIGLVREGCIPSDTDDQDDGDVVKACHDTAKLLKQLGAVVEDVSIPLHSLAGGIWFLYVLEKFVEKLFYSRKSELWGVDEQGRERNRAEFLREKLLENAASWSVPFRSGMLGGEWLRQQLHGSSFRAGEAYKEQLQESYEEALSKYEVLLMPTVRAKAKKLPRHLGTAAEYESADPELIIEHAVLSLGLSSNTVAANLTGHPALSVPVGRAVSNDDGRAFPSSVMLVGNPFHEATLYRVGSSIEGAPSPSSTLSKPS